MLSSGLTQLLLLSGAATAAFLLLVVLSRQARRRDPRVRQLEAPNSEYRSPYAEAIEAQRRWEGMDLAALHAVNREEVVRLLEEVKVRGARSLGEGERQFLDRMASAVGSRGSTGGGAVGGSAPDGKRDAH